MALIVANSENTFEGAIVFNGEKKKYVYKVNKKTIYVGDLTYDKMNEYWEGRIKGTTWKAVMAQIKAEIVDFGVWKIDADEASKKEGIDKINLMKKKQTAPMSKRGELQMEALYKIYVKSLTGAKKCNYRFPNEIGTDRIIVVLFNENRWSILSINGEMYFYDLNDKIYLPFNLKKDKIGKDVIWPVREYEKSEQKIA